MSLLNHIKESSRRIKDNIEVDNIFGVPVVYVNPFVNPIDMPKVRKIIETKLSLFLPLLQQKLDGIYIGDFNFFDKRNINAAYLDGVIYVTNKQVHEVDIIDDVIHEAGHVIEQEYNELIYGDGELEDEFNSKKAILARRLINNGFQVPAEFFETSFSQQIDNYLHRGVGYAELRGLSGDIFLSPYSITSLREYFGIGFEEIIKKGKNVKAYCPVLYQKIREIYSHEKARF